MGDARPLYRRYAAAFKTGASDLSAVCGAITHARVNVEMEEDGGWRPSPELLARVERLEKLARPLINALEREFEDVVAQVLKEGSEYNGDSIPVDEQAQTLPFYFKVDAPVEFVSFKFKIDENGQAIFVEDKK